MPGSGKGEEVDSLWLVERFQRGERQVMEDLYLRYFDRVYRYVRVLLVRSADVDLPPTTLTPTMPVDNVRAQVTAALPVWAHTANVQVQNVAAGERRIAVDLDLSTLQFPGTDLADLTSTLLDKQIELNHQGAGVGSVLARIRDVTDQTPLMTFAGDASWGQVFTWLAPQTAAFELRPNPGILSDPGQDAQQLANGAQQEPDPSGVLPSAPPGG